MLEKYWRRIYDFSSMTSGDMQEWPWLVKSLAVWALIILAETVHGILRNKFLVPIAGDFRARQIAVFTGTLIIYSIAFLFEGWMGLTTDGQRIGVGLLWAILTVAFDIGLGRAFRFTWKRILSDFNLFQGGLMPIGLVLMALALILVSRF
ncbi:MAG: hypothetical protein HZA04_09675 [Nitrospinae bacterium]|nr:hypothetical protein [Nitrospinota bacterium]